MAAKRKTTRKRKATTGGGKSRVDQWAEQTKHFVRMIKKSHDEDVPPAWIKGWKALGGVGNMLPRNVSTGNFYRGHNVFRLWVSAAEHGYESPYWVGFGQAVQIAVRNARAHGVKVEERKGKSGKTYYVDADTDEMIRSITKGEKGTDCVKWIFKDKLDENGNPVILPSGKVDQIPIPIGFRVFNVEQTENVLPDEAVAVDLLLRYLMRTIVDEDHRRADIEGTLAALGIEVRHGGNRACYYPGADYIKMPKIEAFVKAATDRGFEGEAAQAEAWADYYATLLHEYAHATGHAGRLDRDFSGRFGDEAYAFEELIAELTAAFLCATFGIEARFLPDQDHDNHKEYLQGWLRVLGKDTRAICTASKQAMLAADFILAGAEKALAETEDEDHDVAHAA